MIGGFIDGIDLGQHTLLGWPRAWSSSCARTSAGHGTRDTGRGRKQCALLAVIEASGDGRNTTACAVWHGTYQKRGGARLVHGLYAGRVASHLLSAATLPIDTGQHGSDQILWSLT
jgi:hypothetical protein